MAAAIDSNWVMYLQGVLMQPNRVAGDFGVDTVAFLRSPQSQRWYRGGLHSILCRELLFFFLAFGAETASAYDTAESNCPSPS
jgi:hypothetical protein